MTRASGHKQSLPRLLSEYRVECQFASYAERARATAEPGSVGEANVPETFPQPNQEQLINLRGYARGCSWAHLNQPR